MHIKRWIAILAVATVAGVALVVGVSIWQDWSFRQEQIALLHEADLHALGPDNPPSPDSFFPVEAVARPPLVSGVQMLPAVDASQRIDQDELVIGVIVEGKARAYPLNVMTGPEREVFNDTLGGLAIAATW